MRVAAIDIGTNAVLLLIADVSEDGALVPVVDRAEITRLGQGVDRTRALAPEAIERTLTCLRGYAAEISRHHVAVVGSVGTSALRDVGDGGRRAREFLEGAAEIFGAPPRVLSGDEEAGLAFSGGVLGLVSSGDVTAFDVGGGSTEIIRGQVEGQTAKVERRKSLDIGSVRLFERHVRADPPSATEISVVRAFVLEQLRDSTPPTAGEPLVGMAGTVTTLAAVARSIDPYDPVQIHGMRLGADEISEAARRLSELPLAERKKVRGLEPKRADVIPIGAAIVEAILSWAKARDVTVSDRGLRWGVAERLARGAWF